MNKPGSSSKKFFLVMFVQVHGFEDFTGEIRSSSWCEKGQNIQLESREIKVLVVMWKCNFVILILSKLFIYRKVCKNVESP